MLPPTARNSDPGIEPIEIQSGKLKWPNQAYSHGILNTLNFPTDFPTHTPEDGRRTRQIVEMLHPP